jgi:hypothetical protein
LAATIIVEEVICLVGGVLAEMGWDLGEGEFWEVESFDEGGVLYMELVVFLFDGCFVVLFNGLLLWGLLEFVFEGERGVFFWSGVLWLGICS